MPPRWTPPQKIEIESDKYGGSIDRALSLLEKIYGDTQFDKTLELREKELQLSAEHNQQTQILNVLSNIYQTQAQGIETHVNEITRLGLELPEEHRSVDYDSMVEANVDSKRAPMEVMLDLLAKQSGKKQAASELVATATQGRKRFEVLEGLYGDVIDDDPTKLSRGDYLLTGEILPGEMEYGGQKYDFNLTGELQALLQKGHLTESDLKNLTDDAYVAGVRDRLTSPERITSALQFLEIDSNLALVETQMAGAQAELRRGNRKDAEEIFANTKEIVVNSSDKYGVGLTGRIYIGNTPVTFRDFFDDPDDLNEWLDDARETNPETYQDIVGAVETMRLYAETGKGSKFTGMIGMQATAYKEFMEMRTILETFEGIVPDEITKEEEIESAALKMIEESDTDKAQEYRYLQKRNAEFIRSGFLTSDEASMKSALKINEYSDWLTSEELNTMATGNYRQVAASGLGKKVEDMELDNKMYMTSEDIEEITAEQLYLGMGAGGGHIEADTVGGIIGKIPAMQALGWTADGINQLLFNAGGDIYNVAALPMNYISTFLTGYNPGFSGQQFMQEVFSWTGADSSKVYSTAFDEFTRTPFDVQPGQFIWDNQDKEEIDDILNRLSPQGPQ